MKKSVVLLVFAIIAIYSNSSQPQTILDYTRTTFTGTYQQISGTAGPSGDDYAENYSLPFTFYYIIIITRLESAQTDGLN